MAVMRWLLLAILVSTAWADKKVVDMTPGYKRELTSCETEHGGVQRMIDKAKRYLASEPADKAEIEADVERLAKGLEIVSAYCKEVGAMVELLEANAATPYKKVATDIDTHFRAVRDARKTAKKELDDLAPITRKLIPIVNARIPQLDDKKRTGKFPSGRVAEMPAGTWKLGGNASTDIAELATKTATATVTSQPFVKASCELPKKQLLAKAGDQPVTELELSAAAKKLGVAWSLRYVRRDKTPHVLTTLCLEDGSGGFLAVADVTPADDTKLADSLDGLMVSMLATRSAETRSPAP
jgi:hypothetical protein